MKVLPGFAIIAAVLACAVTNPRQVVLARGSLCTTCPVAEVDSGATNALGAAQTDGPCSTGRGATGYPIPDPKCTPGAYTPTVPSNVFGSEKFRKGVCETA